MSKVCVRYAPSPTGVPHIGNIRTALFNFLFAKNQNGQFLLRIEDTDQKRVIPDAINKIKESLLVLGLKWDREYMQSQRLPLYHHYLQILKEKDLVYQEEGAWRLKVKSQSLKSKISWEDLVHGPIGFSPEVVEDFVIIKSDDFPTYHFASVVDDHEMQISHVMRGDEWISSTPKHLLLYQAFGWQPPIFVHLPPILGPNRKKLSKREGAKSVLEYIQEGFLPEALVNFLVLLGWAPLPSEALSEGGKREKEFFSLEELIKEFSLERLNKNSPTFNLEKLRWFNKKYLQKYSLEELTRKIKNFSELAKKTPTGRLSKIVGLVHDRLTTLADFEKYAAIFFKTGTLSAPSKGKIENAKRAILTIDRWELATITEKLDDWIAQHQLDSADFKNTLRLTVFADHTPPIYQSLAVLTKEEVLERIEDALKKAR